MRIKKIICLLLIIGLFFSSIEKILAKTLTIVELSSKFNNSQMIEGLNQLGAEISSSIDTTNNKLNIYEGNEIIFSFNYTDEYIEYDNRSAVVTEDSVENEITTGIMVYSVIDTILNLSGYEGKTISEDETYEDTYDAYGIQLVTEHYSFNGTHPEGGEWTSSGDFVKYFKMSFDTSKIDNLMSQYGVDESTQDPNIEVIAGLTPTLEAKEITTNSVTLYPHIPYMNADPDYTVNCYIYRSDSENGNYDKISEMASNCLDNIGVIDDNLNSGTTYWYKTVVDGGTIYSSPLKVVTKGNSQEIENPQTGVGISIVSVGTILGICLVGLLIIRKKAFLKQI